MSRQADALREYARTHTNSTIKDVFHALADFFEKSSDPSSDLNKNLDVQAKKAAEEAAKKAA